MRHQRDIRVRWLVTVAAAASGLCCHNIFPYSPGPGDADGVGRSERGLPTPMVITVTGDGKCGRLCGPHDLHLGDGTLYVASIWSYRICAIGPPVIGEQIVDFAGKGQPGDNEGALLGAGFMRPSAVTSLSPGRFLVADSGNHRLRLLDASADITSSFAGSGSSGFADGPASTATFNEPGSMIVVGGEVFVVDTDNHRIRKITAAGVVTTFAGDGVDATVDGSLLGASFNDPHGIAYDATSAAFYVTECSGNVVRKIASGQVTTFAGGAAGFANGPRLQAQFHCPAGIVAHDGALIVADCDNNRVRLIKGESVTTLAGAGQFGHQDGPALTAVFACPDGIALDAAAGILYVSDYGVMPDKPASVYIRAITGLVL